MHVDSEKAERVINGFKVKHICPEKGSVEYGYNTLKKIIVFIEDYVSGFEFWMRYFSLCYPFGDITLVSLGGVGKSKYILYYLEKGDIKYSDCIIVYDRGAKKSDRKTILKVINNLQRQPIRPRIHVFSPLAFESIPLSFVYLLDDFLRNCNIDSEYLPLHNDIKALIKGDILNVDYDSYITSSDITAENLVEKAIEDITKGTIYEVRHEGSCISPCWLNECCEINKEAPTCNRTMIENYNVRPKKKLELIASNSVLGGMTYIMNRIYRHHYKVLPKVITDNVEYRESLVNNDEEI